MFIINEAACWEFVNSLGDTPACIFWKLNFDLRVKNGSLGNSFVMLLYTIQLLVNDDLMIVIPIRSFLFQCSKFPKRNKEEGFNRVNRKCQEKSEKGNTSFDH